MSIVSHLKEGEEKKPPLRHFTGAVGGKETHDILPAFKQLSYYYYYDYRSHLSSHYYNSSIKAKHISHTLSLKNIHGRVKEVGPLQPKPAESSRPGTNHRVEVRTQPTAKPFILAFLLHCTLQKWLREGAGKRPDCQTPEMLFRCFPGRNRRLMREAP